ncbi:MAG: T9SS type A sorting domain-containing protein [Bacteroidetes bacterium]|nr:MAG: T9SS type A sorting domain-containing protein [Bacteroidota bacterium]
MQSVPSINFVSVNLLALLILFTPYSIFSQPTESQLKKFSLPLQKKWKETSANESSYFIIAVKDSRVFKNEIAAEPRIKIVYEYPSANVLLLKAKWDEVIKTIVPNNEVLFVDEQRIPKEERAVSDLDLSTDKVNLLFSKYPQYNGNNLVVSVKENRPDIGDIDFHGRYLPTTLTSNIFSTHATDMATIIAGAGNTYYEGKGVAWGAKISSSSFVVLLPDPDAAYQQYNITVQNHSYGTSIENFYGADAAAYDASVVARPSLMHIFSAGNSGTQTSTSGPYANVPGFANITGSFKMAKNIITVGHMDSLGTVLAPSSRGPAYDGRVKPELVAYAEDGSSGAAAIVSGISLSLQQAYKDLQGLLPSSALVKAILLNSADDVEAKGIDFISGYGAANAYKAVLELVNGQYFNGTITHGASDVYNLVVPPNTRRLKITLVWNDPPATANASKALMNDLDLELSLPTTNESWQPWVLNHFPKTDSLELLPLRKRDSLNNVEQVSVENPAVGNYEIRVKGYNVAMSPQTYSVAYQLDTLDKFTWFYPTRTDNIFNSRSNILRWESTYNISTGRLEYSTDNGNSWQLIDDAVVLANGYFKWTPPDNFTTAILKMNVASQNFVSDTFTISKRFDVFVGFNCPDSFMLFWNRISGVDSYQVYRLGEKYMEPLLTTVDTAVVLAKQTNTSLYYAIAPLLKNKTGVRSYAYNYTNQGVACYVRTILAQLIVNSAKLDLELGTIYNVKSITWQKLTTNGYVPLQTINNISGLTFSYIDNTLTHGLNVYRVKIELMDGRVVNSETVTVYFAQEPYIVYPNPVAQYQPVTLISNDPDIAQLEVFNTIGQKVLEKTLNDFSNTIATDRLSKGIYLLRIVKDNQAQATLKLIVY